MNYMPSPARRSFAKQRLERHADERAKQRLGVGLTDDLRTEIVRLIKRRRKYLKRLVKTLDNNRSSSQYGSLYEQHVSDAVMVGQSRDGREIWRVDVEDVGCFRVVYEPRRKVIVTILP